MHGETEIPQKMEVDPESIRIGNMQAQAGIGTRLMLSSFGPSSNVEQMNKDLRTDEVIHENKGNSGI